MTRFGITDIRKAAERLAGRVVRTPVLSSPMLDELAGAKILIKAESLQLTGAFKIRGALNKVLSLDERSQRAGVVAFSAGNHGQAVAAAARMVGCPAVVVLPSTAARIKVDNTAWWGADIVFYDPATDDRVAVSRDIASTRGMTLIPPFDDPDVMAGQGTVGLELADQLREQGNDADAVLIPCSGGGLSAGVTEAMKSAFPGITGFVVEPHGYDKMARSLASGTPCGAPDTTGDLLGAIGGPVVGEHPLAVLRRHDITGLTITEKDALHAVALAFRLLKIVVEPGAAAALAAVITRKADFRDQTVAVICSGGNVDASVLTTARRNELR